MPKNEDYITGAQPAESSASNVVEELRDSFKPPAPGAPVTAAERIEDAVSMVQNAAREEQMYTEQDLQNCLSKASTHVADSQAIDSLFSLSQQIASLTAQGDTALTGNITQVNELVTELGAQLAMQQAKSDRQVAIALHEAVSAMCDAQNAMFQSMSISEMQQLVKGASRIVSDVHMRNTTQDPDKVQ